MAKISSKNIAQAIYEATEEKSGEDLNLAIKRGAKLIRDKRLLGKSSEILDALQKIIDKRSNTVRMKVFTGKPIGDAEKKKLEHEIKDKYKADTVVSEFYEKSELLGGIRIEVMDDVMDNTYKGRLERLEKFLIQK